MKILKKNLWNKKVLLKQISKKKYSKNFKNKYSKKKFKKNVKCFFLNFWFFFQNFHVLALEQRFIQSLAKFDAFLKTKLDDETDARLFIDSNKMTLADCNLLPKLHIAITAARERREFELPPVRIYNFKKLECSQISKFLRFKIMKRLEKSFRGSNFAHTLLKTTSFLFQNF